MIVSVLIPSYRRTRDLERCLGAVARQTRAADQVLVVARVGDDENLRLLQAWVGRMLLEVVEVTVPGQVQALNAGLARVQGDIVAITDDDAAPRPDWLARIEAHFLADPKIGGVGGRDWVHQNGVVEAGERLVVGRVHWFGRISGNHHLGAGNAREVDVLKGSNCAFRLTALQPIGFNPLLKGAGAQVHNDMMASLAVKRAGWRLVYDPQVAVDHYPAARFDHDQRGAFNPQATFNRAYNRRMACALIRPVWRRRVVLAWDMAVGTSDEPGLIGLVRGIMRGDRFALRRYKATISAYWAIHAGQPREV